MADPDLTSLENARQYRLQQRYADAEAIYRSVLARDPDNPTANFDFGTLLQEHGQHAAAIQLLQKAVSRGPGNIWARFALAVSLKALLRLDEAAHQYERIIATDSSMAVAHNNLGNIYKDLLRHADAEQCFLKALACDPGMAVAMQNLGGVYTEMGRPDEAIEMYRQSIRIKPDYAKAHHHLAFTKRHAHLDDEIRAMEALYKNPAISATDRCHLAFGLGKANHDLGQYPEAFVYFADGNRLKHQLDRYPLTHVLGPLDAMRSIPLDFGTDVNATEISGEITPIFVIGMPRSGTSLTEQVLASHSMVHGAGELPTIGQLITRSVRNFPRDLTQIDDQRWLQLGQQYLDHVRQLANGSAFVVDKMPGNFVYAGLIRKMLPHARIVHCRRDPLDTCLSCFKSYFLDPSLTWSNDLSELGSYYLRYQSLMAYWQQLMPGQIFDTRYEDLVTRPEQTIARLLDACGLSHEENCLQFRGSRRTVATASAMQVRQAIHGKSVGGWRHYEKELQPLIEMLA